MLWKIQRYFHIRKLRRKVNALIFYLEKIRYNQSNHNLNEVKFMFAEVVYLWEKCVPWGKYFICGEYVFSYDLPLDADPYDVKNKPHYDEWVDIIKPLYDVINQNSNWKVFLKIDNEDLSV